MVDEVSEYGLVMMAAGMSYSSLMLRWEQKLLIGLSEESNGSYINPKAHLNQ